MSELALTNALNIHLNPWTHDLVPAIDIPYQPSRSIKAASTTKRVRKGCCRREVLFYRRSLLFGRRLAEVVYNTRNIGD